MLMQMSGPRDIVIYWPGPWAFSVVQKPWAGHTFQCKSPGVPRGGMVTSQIDICIMEGEKEMNREVRKK